LSKNYKLIPTPDAPIPVPDIVSDMLSNRITAIAGDVLDLFPGGIETLPARTDEEIQVVVNNFASPGDGCALSACVRWHSFTIVSTFFVRAHSRTSRSPL
jgi:hypothetical protein